MRVDSFMIVIFLYFSLINNLPFNIVNTAGLCFCVEGTAENKIQKNNNPQLRSLLSTTIHMTVKSVS